MDGRGRRGNVRFFEDCSVGDEFRSEQTFTVTAEAITEYARSWDPMPYHLDDEEARASPVGELFAPAVLTLSIAIRLTHDSGFYGLATVAGLGIDEIRMPRPVLVGDELSVVVSLADKRVSESRPGLGVLTTRTELSNQRGEVVMSYGVSGLVQRRETS